jgi:hypothetical protein
VQVQGRILAADGALRLETGDAREGRRRLRAAQAIFQRIGARPEMERIENLMRGRRLATGPL